MDGQSKRGSSFRKVILVPKLNDTELLKAKPQICQLDKGQSNPLKCSFMAEHNRCFRHDLPIILVNNMVKAMGISCYQGKCCGEWGRRAESCPSKIVLEQEGIALVISKPLYSFQ